MAISATTSRVLRTPRLSSLPCSSAKTRIEPERMTYTPSAGSPAVHRVSPKAMKRLWHCPASCSSSSLVKADSSSTDDMKSARDSCTGAASMVASFPMARSARLDHVFLGPGSQPFLPQQAADFRGGFLVQARRVLGVHQEDLEEGAVGGREGPQQGAGRGVEDLGLDVGLQRPAQHLADEAALLAGVGDGMLPRQLGEALRVVGQERHHLPGLALGLQHDVAHLDAVEAGRVELEVLLHRLVARSEERRVGKECRSRW